MSRGRAGGAEDDQRYMGRALELARNGLGLASPNPMVGAVVVADGGVVGEGWHLGPGTPHAEVVALGQAGERARGATLYVTLEPCSHFGRTPPCANAVADVGISRVVAALHDPNPLVDGRGVRLLSDRGVAVTVGVRTAEGERLVEGFAKHVRTGLPFVTVKMAATLDGRTAARDGSSRWITGSAAREDVHRMRAVAGAIAVGVGTVLADDPALTVRLDGYRGRPPTRVVIDSKGRTPAGARVIDPTAPTIVATTSASPPEARRAWERSGAEVWVMDDPQDEGRVALCPVVERLGKAGVQDLLVEGGPTLAWSTIRSGAADRLVLYLAPKILGAGGPGVLEGGGFDNIAEAMRVEVVEVLSIGEDVKVVADVHRDR